MSVSSGPLLPACASHLFSMLFLDFQGSWDHLLWYIAWARTERCPFSAGSVASQLLRSRACWQRGHWGPLPGGSSSRERHPPTPPGLGLHDQGSLSHAEPLTQVGDVPASLFVQVSECLMPQPARAAASPSPRCSPVADGCGKGCLEQGKERGQGAVAGGGGGARSCFPCGVSCSPPIVWRRP